MWVRTRDREQQGMIQAAVALHHLRRGNVRGARKMVERALTRVTEPVMREYLERLREEIERLSADALIRRRPTL